MPDQRDDAAAVVARPPSVDALLRDPRMRDPIRDHGASSAAAARRVAIDEARAVQPSNQ